MFETKRQVRLSETDATGVWYFTNLLKFATEAFEEFIEKREKAFLERFLLPIVSVKADYLAPLFLGDGVIIKLRLLKVGSSSFTLHTDIEKAKKVVAFSEIVHVCIDRETNKKIQLPENLRDLLKMDVF